MHSEKINTTSKGESKIEMAKERIEYIDWLKGLSIILVVWFHTPNPEWLSFHFRVPLFFLLSGIFFKVVPFREHIARKTNQLVVPFIFFYLVGFIYMIGEYRWSPTHSGEGLPLFWTFTDLFHYHHHDQCFLVNPPLWFIPALLIVQLILYLLVRFLRNRTAVLVVSIAISAVGICYTENVETRLMFGRALRYTGYYAFGYLYGKQILAYLEQSGRNIIKVAVLCAIVMIASGYSTFGPESHLREPATYLFNIALIVSLIILFRYLSRIKWLRFFHFFGRNSYVVLGIHYMFNSIFIILIFIAFGEVTVRHSYFILIMSLLALTPVIKFCNRYIPALVGRKELLKLRRFRSYPLRTGKLKKKH